MLSHNDVYCCQQLHSYSHCRTKCFCTDGSHSDEASADERPRSHTKHASRNRGVRMVGIWRRRTTGTSAILWTSTKVARDTKGATKHTGARLALRKGCRSALQMVTLQHQSSHQRSSWDLLICIICLFLSGESALCTQCGNVQTCSSSSSARGRHRTCRLEASNITESNGEDEQSSESTLQRRNLRSS